MHDDVPMEAFASDACQLSYGTKDGDTDLMELFAAQTESIIKQPIPQVISHIANGIKRDLDEDEESYYL